MEDFKLNLEEYRKSAQTLARLNVDWEFDNPSDKHAAIVLATILDNCNEVLIYDTHLEGDIAYAEPSFIDSLTKFSKSSGKVLKIVVRNAGSNGEKQKLFEEIEGLRKSTDFKADIQICETSKDFTSSIAQLPSELFNLQTNNDINFAVGDGRSYRYEVFDTNTEKRLYRAKCNFNGVSKAIQLQEKFNNAYTSCSAIK